MQLEGRATHRYCFLHFLEIQTRESGGSKKSVQTMKRRNNQCRRTEPLQISDMIQEKECDPWDLGSDTSCSNCSDRELRMAAWLTFSLGDGAADRGAGGSDCAHGGAHAIRRVHPSHRRRVGHPSSWVNGSDRLACEVKGSETRTTGFCKYKFYWIQKIKVKQEEGKENTHSEAEQSSCEDWGPNTWRQSG